MEPEQKFLHTKSPESLEFDKPDLSDSLKMWRSWTATGPPLSQKILFIVPVEMGVNPLTTSGGQGREPIFLSGDIQYT